MSLEKMIYDADTGTAIYRSKMPASAAEATGVDGEVGSSHPGAVAGPKGTAVNFASAEITRVNKVGQSRPLSLG